ncbi:MAG TPA: von Willebrand factor type A domain-containing protein, partial [Planctomycetota bacterium]|nr:von Willebrand factor type A domain-containing protein [Planctomycetota bacterium]
SEAAERAALEAEIAADPALAAERERLAATIGLVSSLAADVPAERLSPEAAARLASAAAGGGRMLAGPGSSGRVWYASPVFRAAAGFALVLGAFALWRGSQGGTSLRHDVLTADAEPAAARRAADGPFLYDEWGESEREKRAKDEFALREAPPSEPEPVMDAIDPSGLTEAQDLDAGLVRELTALGSTGGAQEEAKLGSRFQAEQLGAERVQLLERQASSGPGSPGPSGPGAPVGGGSTYRGPGDSGAPGAEGRFGGRGGNKRLLAKNADTAPAASPAQSSPAPTVAKSSATTGSDEFFLGRGEAKQEPEGQLDGLAFNDVLGGGKELEDAALERLRGLGYIGDDDQANRQARIALQELGYAGVAGEERHERPLTHEQRTRAIELLLADCRRRPSEHPRDMFYRWWGDNPFEYARTDALSTFAVDVDTASYTLARRYLVDGHLPTKQQIRTEEFVNYFKGDVPAPSEETFAVATELAPTPFNRSGDAWTLRVVLRGREVSRQERQPLALTFVVDVSGSMSQQNRLELVKHAMRLLVGEMDARDSLSIVAFSNESRLVLPMTSARNRGLIESAIHPLAPQGGTNVQAGLRMGYEAALAGLDPEAHNRVVFLSDGVGNIGETDATALSREVESARKRGVWLNTVGVGMGNHNDAFLEQLADKGNGLCNYVDDEREARRALVENFTGAFEPIAKDVKIQVEFDPRQVERYRLLGYENRAIADADFRNDAVDAGEVGAGHQVVALYEVVRTGDGDGPLATVRVRWKPVAVSLSSAMLQQLANAP